jgi:hypothetical protein
VPGLALAAIVTYKTNRERAVHIAHALGGFALPVFVLFAWNLWAHHTLTP